VQAGLTDCKDIAVSIGVIEYWSDGVLEYWSDAHRAMISPSLLLRGIELWNKRLALEQAGQGIHGTDSVFAGFALFAPSAFFIFWGLTEFGLNVKNSITPSLHYSIMPSTQLQAIDI
jgi:hypothetical protein